MGHWFIGIDLGGTSMKLGMVDEQGQLIGKTEEPTSRFVSPEVGLDRMVGSVKLMVDQTGISWDNILGLGIGLPGFLDIPRGRIVKLTNIPWENVPIQRYLEDRLQVPVSIDNDANAAALGEAWSGAGVGIRDMICITLGTGVGGGIIANGGLIHGVSGMAGEVGHIQVEKDGDLCSCGQRGCVETLSSATGMLRLVREAVNMGKQTRLQKSVEQGSLQVQEIFEEAKRGDPVAKGVIGTAIDGLGRLMAILSVVNNPEAFIIGGGISKAGPFLFEPLQRSYGLYALSQASAGVRIIPAQLGNDAGIIGAAGLQAKQAKVL
ncbi:ROK family glucokinase [Kroppenstedtia pulmonis]|uniref:Glucokinase n=1 Tax=Kroppenstedtia pulmonis TaxID=1380685 RepID=A0A7D4CUG1_9BACL|nr:ROK family glucokinase [Kroppenstedtia pulmonis]QKG83217.1 ROK family glucokinase [Kroppenstedtia pulmonis]